MQMQRTKLNKKGFTLVELLAVIVILAIILIIAAPQVLDAMNKAKKATFQLQGERILGVAMAQYIADVRLGEITGQTCYSLSDLNLNAHGYNGYVVVDGSNYIGTDENVYYLFLTDNTYEYRGTEYNLVYNDTSKIEVLSKTNASTITSCPADAAALSTLISSLNS